MKRHRPGRYCGVAIWLLFFVLADVSVWMTRAYALQYAKRVEFDPTLTIEAVLPPGALGLEGDPVLWVMTVDNRSAAVGTDVIVTGTLPIELRIDSAETENGDIAVSDQVAAFMIPSLNPGETIQMRINSTVMRRPVNGALVAQAMLTANGPDAEVVRQASGEVFVPTQLPATGYARGEELPGEGEPSALEIGLLMLSIVVVGAAFVWYRGRR